MIKGQNLCHSQDLFRPLTFYYIMNVLSFGLLSTATVMIWSENLGWLGKRLSFYSQCTYISCSLQTYFLVSRWIQVGHFPLSNLYESLFFLSWALTVFVLGSELLRHKKKFHLIHRFHFGSIIMPLIVLINGFMVFLPSYLKLETGLVPALQSHWLQMHVWVMITGYASLMLGCLLAIGYLVLNAFEQPKEQTALEKTMIKRLAYTCDNYSYRCIGLGFPLLTLGLLSGAIWANQTWGSYWSWDPKETWALISWFVFAVYLHTRYEYAWDKSKSAWLAVGGFVTLWVCYLGVNLMAKGLHSYGWFQ